MFLTLTWFLLIAASLAVYLLWGGYGLGGAMLALFAQSAQDRRMVLRAMRPLVRWADLWLLFTLIALAISFPAAAKLYWQVWKVPLVLLLLLLLFRFALLNTLLQRECGTVREMRLLALFSLGASFLLGVILFSLIPGFLIDGDFLFQGKLFSFLSPYALLGGLATTFLFLLHSATVLSLRGWEDLADRLTKIVPFLWVIVIFFAAALLGWTLAIPGYIHSAVRVAFWVSLGMTVVGLTLHSVFYDQREALLSVLSSSILIVGGFSLFISLLFPVLLPSTLGSGVGSITLGNGVGGSSILRLALIPALLVFFLLAFKTIRAIRSSNRPE